MKKVVDLDTYITERYYAIAKELRPHLPEKAPEMVFTKSRRFWANIRKRKSGEYVDVRINLPGFKELYLEKGIREFEEKLQETICHELAHMTHWDHSQRHKNLLNRYTSLVTFKSMEDLAEDCPGLAVAAEEIKGEGKITKLSDLVSDTKKARAALRKAGIQKPGTKWEWTNEVPEKVRKVLGL